MHGSIKYLYCSLIVLQPCMTTAEFHTKLKKDIVLACVPDYQVSILLSNSFTAVYDHCRISYETEEGYSSCLCARLVSQPAGGFLRPHARVYDTMYCYGSVVGQCKAKNT